MAADGTGTIREGFTTDEFGLTCGYKFDLAKGRAWLIGGGFLQNFDYSQTVIAVPGPLSDRRRSGSMANMSRDFGLGAAYEIPEMAVQSTDAVPLRGRAPQYSGLAAVHGFGWHDGLPAVSSGTALCRSLLELKLQVGIAPGWLAFGTVKWTDWSVLDTLDYTIIGARRTLGGDKQLEYYYKDGWTVTGGLGHSFSESISGVAGLTWDRGVSTTEDTLSDTYTFAAGVALKDKLGGEVRFGGAVTYLTAASVDAADPTMSPVLATRFAYTVDGDFAYALSAGYKISW